MKKPIKNLKISTVHQDFNLVIKQQYHTFLKDRKNAKYKTPKFAKKNKGKLMRLSKCAVCDSKTSRFIKEQEASRLLNSLGLNTG